MRDLKIVFESIVKSHDQRGKLNFVDVRDLEAHKIDSNLLSSFIKTFNNSELISSVQLRELERLTKTLDEQISELQGLDRNKLIEMVLSQNITIEFLKRDVSRLSGKTEMDLILDGVETDLNRISKDVRTFIVPIEYGENIEVDPEKVIKSTPIMKDDNF